MTVFSKKEIAEKIGVSQRTVDNWMSEGRLSYSKVGRKVLFSETDLEDLLKTNHRDAFYYQKQYEQKLNNFLEQRKSTKF
jgi:excisionase family DNA binding protein